MPSRCVIGLLFYVIHLFPHSLYCTEEKNKPSRANSKHCNPTRSPCTGSSDLTDLCSQKHLTNRANDRNQEQLDRDLAHNNRCTTASEPRWESETASARISYHHLSLHLGSQPTDLLARFFVKKFRFLKR